MAASGGAELRACGSGGLAAIQRSLGSRFRWATSRTRLLACWGRISFTDPEADIWLPFQFEPNSTNQGHFFLGAAMLKPGVTLAQANAQMKLAYGRISSRRIPESDPKGGFAVQPLRDTIVRRCAQRRCWCCWARWAWCC